MGSRELEVFNVAILSEQVGRQINRAIDGLISLNASIFQVAISGWLDRVPASHGFEIGTNRKTSTICNIPIGPEFKEDRINWHFDDKGRFSARSCNYYLIKVQLKASQDSGMPSFQSGFSNSKNWLEVDQPRQPLKAKIIYGGQPLMPHLWLQNCLELIASPHYARSAPTINRQ
ncbi:conserved hypothetical protein [Ricinus communis]|uniref:Uncharacterized protein n=1 Tax=Ricinus communis TaxID=3988 RepID=B9RCM5_RICCO|nr:conserved hypothetical protein [Ricinus communis]